MGLFEQRWFDELVGNLDCWWGQFLVAANPRHRHDDIMHIDYDEAFRPVFAEFTDWVELTSVETVQAGMMTELRYGIRLRRDAGLHRFVERLQCVNGNNRILLTTMEGEQR